MKFGKLADISQVDFQLPPDAAGNREALRQSPVPEGAARLYIGCTGWSMKEWVGTAYPKGAKSKDFLKYYGQQFNTIELNTTHYRIPNTAAIEKWYRETPGDFRFCPKLPQSISHSKTLGLGAGLISTFCDAIAGLQEKLGCCFVQLPPYFGYDRMPQLQRFLEAFPTHIPLAVEARHHSWFDEPDHTDALLSLLLRHQRAAVLTDVAGRRDVLHMGLSSATTMIRFVGNGLHPSDYERTREWLSRLKQWVEYGVKEIYFFPHQPDNLLAPQMAAFTYEQLREQLPGAVSRGPALESAEGQQGDQMSLF